MYEGKKWDGKTDIWSLGCVLFELCALIRPFAGESKFQVAAKIKSDSPDWEAIPKQYGEETKNLIMQMLSKDPSERPDAKELIKFCEMAFCRLRCS